MLPLLVSQVESLKSQIDRLAAFIMEEVPGEPSQNEGAVDTAIRVIRELRAWKNERTCFGVQDDRIGGWNDSDTSARALSHGGAK